jgi:hypothetical protein
VISNEKTISCSTPIIGEERNIAALEKSLSKPPVQSVNFKQEKTLVSKSINSKEVSILSRQTQSKSFIEAPFATSTASPAIV